jgi:hypothetical protein
MTFDRQKLDLLSKRLSRQAKKTILPADAAMLIAAKTRDV